MLCKSFGSEYKMNNQKNQAVLGFFDIIMFEIALWLWSLDVNCSVASNFNIDTATLYMNAVFVYVNISIAISIFIASFNSSWAIAVSFYFSVISFYVNATTVWPPLTLTLALPLSEDAELSSLLEELALDEEDTLELELSFVSLSAEFPQAAKKKSETSVIRDK